MKGYNHKLIERKWQKEWDKKKTFKALNTSKKKKFYSLIEFPYPSGDGLHVGHPRPYIGMDVISRKKRMDGLSVLYPIGWDAFGLPTENYAIKTGKSPELVTKKNSDNFRRQIKSLGISFDWDREINTTDPKYYKWTQWIFLKFLEKGLAYKKKMTINWCPKDKIGLANEEVINGCCERCGSQVEKREKEQWMLAITKYADRLDKDLDEVDYLPQVKTQQRNWIGKSEGAEISFKVKLEKSKIEEEITVFTTRPDTLFGVTYVVLAPENDLIIKLKEKIKNWISVKEYIDKTKLKSDIERGTLLKQKTGVKIEGIEAIHPITGKMLPLFIADFVLGDYGTGAIMSVPAHDERDFEFAQTFNLPIIQVINNNLNKSFIRIHLNDEDLSIVATELKAFLTPKEYITPVIKLYEIPIDKVLDLISILKKYNIGTDLDYKKIQNGQDFNLEKGTKIEFVDKGVFVGEGILINSDQFNGLHSEEAKKKITDFACGKWKTTFKLRDWVFSRQRYWGEPIPVIHCPKCGFVPVPEKDLPVVLPKVKDYKPTDNGESPLSSISKWVNVKCPKCKSDAKRETDTMPNWAGSSWYYLRYTDPKNNKQFADQKALKYWTPVDWYNGGMEHTTLHLLYSRFWHKFLYDLNLVPTKEPYKKRTSHGLILAKGGEKMSKSRGNVINPDEIVSLYGADTLRVYEMFMGPFDQAIEWNTDSIIGCRRFLEKVWRLQGKVESKKLKVKSESQKLESFLNKTIKKVGEDIVEMKFNTAISSMMMLVNEMEKEESISKENYEKLLLILSPFAPHITEELWHIIGNKKSIVLESWPKFDPRKIQESSFVIAVQVNGKVRGTIEVIEDEEESLVLEKVKKDQNISKWLENQTIKKVIYVKGKIINIVVG
jgi:leucyl-tRNA synthetase